MFSVSSTGSWAELQLPCSLSKEGELSEDMLQNLFYNLPPQTLEKEAFSGLNFVHLCMDQSSLIYDTKQGIFTICTIKIALLADGNEKAPSASGRKYEKIDRYN